MTPVTQQHQHPVRAGFTLVELLIVITIIGMLIALLMPAVNSAMESGRRARCMNNAKQLADGVLAHATHQGFLAGGGWGWGWVGDADRGFGVRQPGGWVYNVLPYIDQVDLHDLGRGANATDKTTFNSQRVGTVLPVTICPTRRKPQPFAASAHGAANFTVPSLVGRTDYGTNGGDIRCEPDVMNVWPSFCGSNNACGPPGTPGSSTFPSDTALNQAQAVVQQWNSGVGPTGTDFPLATLSTASVKDGLSFTYLLGEKWMDIGMYYAGTSLGDNENEYIGFNADIARFTFNQPMQDRPGNESGETNANGTTVVGYYCFGSAHSAGFNMAFGDGSVRLMSYVVDPTVHKQLGNRKDGEPTQLQMLDPK